MTSEEKSISENRISTKLLILILSTIVIINIITAFSYHMFYSASLIHGASGIHHVEHRVIMIFHSLSAPSVGIVSLFFLEVFEIRKRVIKLIKYMVTLGGICGGIGATFWAYTDLFILHHVFVVGLVLIFFSGILLFYGLIPGTDVKNSNYFKDIPKIGGLNILSLSILVIIGGMLVFAIFGLTAALVMLMGDPPVPFFFVEVIFLDRITPKTTYQELASFHMRLITALFLTGILILIFRYTKVKGRAAKIGSWFILPGTIAMTAGYFLMILMGKSANAILMPARGLILFAGVIMAFSAWIQVSKEELGERYSSASWSNKIVAVLKNPVRLGMYIPFILAGLVVIIPGMIIVTKLAAYREITNYAVELSYAMGHPHALATLGATVIFCLVIHNTIPKDDRKQKLIRILIGWLIIASLLIAFPAAAFYFLRSPTDLVTASIIKTTILTGLFFLFFAVLIFLVLLLYQLISTRERFSEKIKPLVIT